MQDRSDPDNADDRIHEAVNGIIAVARHGLAVADNRVPHRPWRSLSWTS
jgi:hypothetical protein